MAAHQAEASPAIRVVLATRSEGKRRELSALLTGRSSSDAASPHGAMRTIVVQTLDEVGVEWTAAEDSIEAFDTFEENAVAKARWFASRVPAALQPCFVMADDSGLAVDALAGAPGVHSKRWAGHAQLTGDALDAANNASLLEALDATARRGVTTRAAQYVCVAACVWPGGELVVRGETAGELLRESRGDDGFGYDPYFWSPELGATFAEVPRDVKAVVSHRGRAFRALVAALRARGAW